MSLLEFWMRWRGKAVRSLRKRGLAETIERVPVVVARSALTLLRDTYLYFSFPTAGFRGVYQSFAEAEGRAPRGAKIGYDHAELAREYLDNLVLRPDSTDYPVMFHLSRLLRAQATVLDFGGNVGIHFLRYAKYLDLRHVTWIVCDVPTITQAGEEACAAIPNISFVTDIAQVNVPRVDILLASGSLQYVDTESADFPGRRLGALGLRPRHVLINQLPLYDGRRFVTLQNGGLVCYPQYVFNRGEYIQAMADLSYELIDHWNDDVDSCIIPFHPERSVPSYSGLLFADTLNIG